MRNRRLAAFTALALGIGAVALGGMTSASAATGLFPDAPASTPVVVDGWWEGRAIDVDLDGTITDINVTLDFEKANMACSGTPEWAILAWNNEITVELLSPAGTWVTLIQGGDVESDDPDFVDTTITYPGHFNSGRVTVVLDDQASALVGNPEASDPEDRVPESGTFRTAGGVLDSLVGEPAAGEWLLVLTDTAADDPLCYYGAALDITTADPGPIAPAEPTAPAEPAAPANPTPPVAVATAADGHGDGTTR